MSADEAAGPAPDDAPRIVRTPAFDRLDEHITFALARHGIVTVHGSLGVGKTVLTEHLAADHPQPIATVILPPRQSSRDLVRWLHRALCEGDDSDDLVERDLQDDLVERLDRPHTVIVRDAQRLTSEAAGQLEWLHSHRRTQLTLILEGGPGTPKSVNRDPQLGARVDRSLTVAPLKDKDLFQALHGIHPMFLSAEVDLLRTIDHKVCHGVLRHWASFLAGALHLRAQVEARTGHRPALDATLARAVLQHLPANAARGDLR